MADSFSGDGDAFASRGDSVVLGINRGTAMHFAARAGDLVSLRGLVERGADVVAGDAVGRVPLECALGVSDAREVVLVEVQDWMGVRKDVGRGGDIGKGKMSEEGREGEEGEQLCLVLAKAMQKRGYDFETELKAVKRYKAPETTWLELAALVGMEKLEGFIRESIKGNEVRK